MKTIVTTLSLFFICFASAHAQVIGDAAVCSGYIYNYSVTPIPNAVNYIWYFPSGWYGVTGQGTTNATATCNTTVGNIYCEAYNAGGNLITTPTINTHWGNGSIGGWNVQPAAIAGCNPTPFSVSVVPNGTGNGGACSGGCGSGTVHPNIHFALYDDVWPAGQFIMFADGISTAIVGLNVGTSYVYQVDITNGSNSPQAILISGVCGNEIINNICTISVNPPILPAFSQTPAAPCIGDTVQLYETTGITNPCWGCSGSITGLNVIGLVLTNPLTAIVTNSSPTADVTGLDANGCTTTDTYNVNTSICSIPGDTIVCSGYTYSYTANIPGAVTYNWTFPNGWYGVTGQGTTNVTATCNVSAGNICAEGFDAGGNTVSSTCIATQFGGGTPVGWDVQPQQPVSCPGVPINLNIVPNASGSGSCPNGCGSGIPVSNLNYAVYDSVWPFGNFLGFADGTSVPVPMLPGIYSYYIYYIDYSSGTSTALAVRIEGACGTATINNVVQLTIPVPVGPGFNQTPDPVCIGDTVDVSAVGATNGSFSPIMGITILNSASNSFTAVVNSLPARALYSGTDINGCPVTEICYINSISCNSSLAGDSVVCSGYTYTFTATIPNAVTYDWLLPTGWYNITGQGTSTITVTCNESDGWVSVTGYDASGGIIGLADILTHFSAGAGWDVQPSTNMGCVTDSYSVNVSPNGTGGGPGCASGCGNGLIHPNIAYAVYSDVWGSPTSFWLMNANGFSTLPFTNSTYYVYQVDVTNGNNYPQAVLVYGGCGTPQINNSFSVSLLIINPTFSQSPNPACVGDTVTVTDVSGLIFNYYQWQALSNATLLSQNQNTATFIITGANANVDLATSCGGGQYNIVTTTCITPVVAFQSSDTIFCDKQSINFTDLSTNNPTSWQWFFPGAVPAASTDQNPQNIYYPTSGAFDVTLIACNTTGCDTFTLNNFIVEYNAAYDSVYQSNDTLYSLTATSYQWYEVASGIIAGATSQYYVPALAGNYYCIIFDSVGCSDASNIIAVTTGIEKAIDNWQLSINPNPNDGSFALVLSSQLPIANCQLTIVNLLGEVIYEKDLENVNGKFSEQINLSEHPKGIYFLKLMSVEKIITQKIIVY